jgi:L-asparaginase
MNRNKSAILIIYSGGTIGMIKDPVTGELKSFDFNHIYKHVPEINRLNVHIDTQSIQQPIDSSEMEPQIWVQIAQIIKDNYDNYDGFVILHGSDTMAFTASALSFMLRGLKKPIILTGSQLPIGTIRTDGKENLITAIEIAADKSENGESIVQEVAVYFEYSLYRGNRSSKISANQFEAFASPNYTELAVAGVTIDYHYDKLFRTNYKEIIFQPLMNNRVGLLKIYPGFPTDAYQLLFDRKYTDAIVIETFGSGNAPSNQLFREYITNYIHSEGIMINVTQCSSGSVQQGKYETSSFFNKVGVISGKDMTTEAAITKVMHVLANTPTHEERIQLLHENLCGEITV